MNFILLSIIIGSLYACIIIITLHRQGGGNSSSTNNTARSSISMIVGILLLLVPLVIYYVSQPNSFADPDTYGDIIASYLSVWNDMPIDPYYRQFPIYVILNKFLGSFTGLEYSQSLVMLHLLSVLSLFLLIIILMQTLDKDFSRTLPLAPIFVSATLISTIYLCAYFNIYIPQVFSLSIFLYLLLSALKKRRLLVILFSIPALIHVSVVPMYIIVMTPVFLAPYLLRQSLSSSYDTSLLLLPLLLFLIYMLLHYGIFELIPGIRDYIKILYTLFFGQQKVITSIAVAQGTYHHNFYNAFALAFQVSLYIVGLYLVTRRVRYHPLSIIFGVISGFLLLIGYMKYYAVTNISYGSLARYVNIDGFLFLALFNIYTLMRLLNNAQSKYTRYMVFAMMLLAVVGALTDPFAFPYKPTAEGVAFSRILTELISKGASVYFANLNNWYYLRPLVSFWAFKLHKSLDYLNIQGVLSPYTIQGTQYQNIVFCSGNYSAYLYNSAAIYIK